MCKIVSGKKLYDKMPPTGVSGIYSVLASAHHLPSASMLKELVFVSSDT